MRYLNMIVREDRETGVLGLMLENIPIYSFPMVATEGALIAHDIIEHQQGLRSIGGIGDELTALGGLWYVRGSTGQLRRDGVGSMHTPHENVAYDIVEMAKLHNFGVPLRLNPIKTKAHMYDADFIEIIEIAKRITKHNIEPQDRHQKRLDCYFDACLHGMRTGARMAMKRYNKQQRLANSMFWNIAEAVDSIVNEVEWEYERFRLAYDRNRAYCEIAHEEY